MGQICVAFPEYLNFTTIFINEVTFEPTCFHEIYQIKDRKLCKHTLNIEQVKFIYFEKATKFCEISTVDLTVTIHIGQI